MLSVFFQTSTVERYLLASPKSGGAGLTGLMCSDRQVRLRPRGGGFLFGEIKKRKQIYIFMLHIRALALSAALGVGLGALLHIIISPSSVKEL